jgi:hypothetical protein
MWLGDKLHRIRRFAKKIVIDPSALYRTGLIHILVGSRFRVAMHSGSLYSRIKHGGSRSENG